jgi:hypothetical protein
MKAIEVIQPKVLKLIQNLEIYLKKNVLSYFLNVTIKELKKNYAEKTMIYKIKKGKKLL